MHPLEFIQAMGARTDHYIDLFFHSCCSFFALTGKLFQAAFKPRLCPTFYFQLEQNWVIVPPPLKGGSTQTQ